ASTCAASSTAAPPWIVRRHVAAERVRSWRAHQRTSRARSMASASSPWRLAVWTSNQGVSRAKETKSRLAMALSYRDIEARDQRVDAPTASPVQLSLSFGATLHGFM